MAAVAPPGAGGGPPPHSEDTHDNPGPPGPPGLAHGGVPHRGGDDALRGCDGGAVPADSRGPDLVRLLAGAVSQPAAALGQLQVAAAVGRVRRDHLPDGEHLFLDRGADSGRRGRARRGHGVAEEAVFHYVTGLARDGSAVAALHAGLPVPGRPGDAPGAVGAQRGVLGLRHVHRARLAHHHLRPVFRGWRHLFRLRPGDHAPGAAPQGVQAGALHPRRPFREPGQAAAAHRHAGGLRVRGGVLHRLVQRQRSRARQLLQPGVRSVLVGHLDHDHLQRVPSIVPVVQEDPPQHPRDVPAVTVHQSRDVVRAVRDHRGVVVVRVRAVRHGALHAILGRLVRPGRQLRLVLHVVPAVRQELPHGVHRRGEGDHPDAAEGGFARMSGRPGGVLAAFRHVDAAAHAVRQVKELGYKDFTVYSPVPNFEVMSAVGHRVSPVRVWTLVGGLTGGLSGYAMTMWMSYDYPLVVGGKALGSVPPYIIIMFELPILLGALSTLAGLMVHTFRTHRAAAYDPRFTNDLVGSFVPCPPERRGGV